MNKLIGILILGLFMSCTGSNEHVDTKVYSVYTARTFDSFDSTRTDTFLVGENIVFGARSSDELGKGEKLECSTIIIGIYEIQHEKIISTVKRDVAPDWSGTRQDLGEDLPYLEPGNYMVRFIKSPSNELYAKGNFVVIEK